MKKSILLFLFRKKQTCLLVLPVFLFVFLFKTAAVASATCTADLNPQCGQPDFRSNSLKATWDLGSHDPASRCHVKVWGGSPGIPGYVNWDRWGSCSGNGVNVDGVNQGFTDDGTYSIQISNDEAGCNPSSVVTRSFNCRRGGSPAPSRIPSPSSTPPGTRSCSVSWNLPDSNPAPNSGMTVEVTGISDSGGWQNIQLSRDNQNVCPQGAGCSLNIQPGPKFILSNVNSGSSGSHTLSFATDNGATKCPQTKTYTAGVAATTVSYRVAENLADLASAPWQSYTAEPMKVDFEFVKDKTPGNKFVWVEFKDSTGKTEKKNAQIQLLGPDPTVSSCVLSFEGNSTVLNLTGQNFGSAKGEVKSGETSLQVREWKDTSIKAAWQNAPVGQLLPVTLTNPYGQTGSGQCSSISQLALGAKVFCRAPSNHQTDNVDLTLIGDYEGGSRVKQKVSIDKDGVIQGLTQKLEASKRYKLSVKAPKSLRRLASFTAGEGVTTVPNFILPVGDIFPADGADGSINSLDKAELNRQFVISQDACGRSGDFNKDCRVNSIDWACMRYDFGKPEDPEPGAGNLPSPTLIPTPTPTPTPTPSSSPSPSPTSTPTPRPDVVHLLPSDGLGG